MLTDPRLREAQAFERDDLLQIGSHRLANIGTGRMERHGEIAELHHRASFQHRNDEGEHAADGPTATALWPAFSCPVAVTADATRSRGDVNLLP